MVESVGKYQRYEEYKDSGVEWLGDVPTDWKCLPIKYLCYVNDGNHGEEYPKESDYTIEELGVPFIRGGNILNFEVTDKDMLYITKEKNTSMRKGRLQVDDILFVNRGDIGKLALISEKHKGANLNSQIAYLRCKDKSINNKFLLYFLASVYVSNLLNSIKMGSVLTQFPIGNILEIKVPLPNSVEQIKISNFLDYETAKIDSLIEKQQQLIELLKEKRQAVISHAVTKGLNPDVAMKDSGVEWLGQVPEHWIVKRLKYLCKVTTGSKDTVNSIDDGKYPFFVRSQTVERINSVGANCEAVLTAGDGAGVGKVYHYYNGKFDFHQRVYMLYDFSSITGRFVYYYLSSNFYKVALEGNAKSTVDSLRLPQFLNFEFAVPSKLEQNSIVDLLEHKTAKIDSLIEKQQQQIKLMQERRTALISAAVTGKIDVRNWQNPHAGLGTQLNKAFKTAGLVNAGFTLPERPIE